MGLLAVLLLAVAGCGGDDKGGGVASLGGSDSATNTTNARASGGKDIRNDLRQALVFTRCMRQHRIDLPDPQITADGIDEQVPAGMRKDDPRLGAAEQACHHYGRLPND